MSEYISREAVEQIIAAQCGECDDACLEFDGIQPDCNQCLLYGAKKAIESIPAADVRPVVLCRDCVNYVEDGEDNGEKMCVIDADWCAENGCYYGFTVHTPPDWFCAGGKKREES